MIPVVLCESCGRTLDLSDDDDVEFHASQGCRRRPRKPEAERRLPPLPPGLDGREASC